MSMLSIVATIVLAATETGTVATTETSEPTKAAIAETPPLTFQLDLAAWLVRLKGEGSNGGPTIQFGDEDGANAGLGNLKGLFRGELTMGRDPWAARVMGTHGSWSGQASGSGTWGGQAINGAASSFDMSWLAMEAHWYPCTLQGDGRRDTIDPVDLRFGPHVGVTWLDVDQSLAGVSNGSSWWSAYGGAELTLDIDLQPFTDLVQRMSVDVGGSVGGTTSNGGLFYKVRGGLTLHFTPHIGATVGYRLMEYKNLKDGDWDISPSFPGLFLALNITF